MNDEALIEKVAEAIQHEADARYQSSFAEGFADVLARAALATIEASRNEIPTSSAEVVPDLGNAITGGHRPEFYANARAWAEYLLHNGERHDREDFDNGWEAALEYREAEQQAEVAALVEAARRAVAHNAPWLGMAKDDLRAALEPFERTLGSTRNETR